MAGLFDYEFQLEKINKHQPPLQKLDKIIDWQVFREPIEKALKNDNRKSNAGRKPYDKLLMFKIIILQRYYNLSDEQTEFQIKDRLSFLQFLGLQIGDNVPDEKTIWLFKEQLKDKDLTKKLFELFTGKLIINGVIAKEGTMVDASFVSVPKQRNKKSDNDIIKKDEIPQSFKDKPNKLAQKDCDARWTKKNNQREYGYKDHIASDQKTKLITKYEVTPASTHDSKVTQDLIDENDNIFYADSAYKSEEIEKYLKEKNVKSKVIKRAYRNKPLTNAQHKENYKHSKTRVRVEHIFGTLTKQMNNALNLTSIGINRIKSAIGLMNLTYNLVRYEQLVRLQKVKIV
ncbi:MAG: IS5 family transposase [Arcobacter sp.]|nr:IS5 family transposase [Arcobacter sp.]